MNRNMNPVRASDHEVQILAGHFAVDSSGDPVSQVGLTGVAVTHDDTGKYSLQLKGSRGEDASVPAMLAVGASVVPGTGGTTSIQSLSAADGKAEVWVYNSSAALADPAEHDLIEVVMYVKNSALPH